MLRILALLLAALSSLYAAPPSYDRLAAAAKLWAYIKYCHPFAASPDLDWDAAFAKAAPKILAATTDEEFSAAISDLLVELHDPVIRIVSRAATRKAPPSRSRPASPKSRPPSLRASAETS